MFYVSVFAERSLNRLVWVKCLHVFLITMHKVATVVTVVEVYLEPFQTFMIELLCENSTRLLALNSRETPS